MQFTGVGSLLTVHMPDAADPHGRRPAAGCQALKELFFFDMLERGIFSRAAACRADRCRSATPNVDRFVAAFDDFVAARKALLQPK